jgi:hypothetical protein
MIKFREVRYSLLPDLLKSAAVGSTAGALTGGISANVSNTLGKTKNLNVQDKKDLSFNWKLKGSVIGAGLAMAYTLLEKLTNSSTGRILLDKKVRNSNYNINMISKVLKMKGFTPDKDFTTNPKIADRLKTKVCIVLRSDSDLLSIIISSVGDDMTKKAMDEIVRGIPDKYKSTVDRTEKGQTISLTAMSSNGGDISYVANVMSQFMNRRIPVYLVEVNS